MGGLHVAQDAVGLLLQRPAQLAQPARQRLGLLEHVGRGALGAGHPALDGTARLLAHPLGLLLGVLDRLLGLLLRASWPIITACLRDSISSASDSSLAFWRMRSASRLPCSRASLRTPSASAWI